MPETTLDPVLLKVAADLLREASVRFADHSCNDYRLPRLSPAERLRFHALFEAWERADDPSIEYTQIANRWFQDWRVMVFLADSLTNESERT